MSRLSNATPMELGQVFERARRRAAEHAWLEDAAQDLVTALRDAFPGSVALARAYVTVPHGALPASNAAWVEALALDKGVLSELGPHTPVISLVGSAGADAEWNDRRASKGHVGIPMVSASFIDAIPMMSRLMASLGGDLAWIDADDTSLIQARLGTVAGTFHVSDAATSKDVKGRLVIPATDFVAKHGIKTVFGVGGAFATGQLLVALVFCTEEIGIETVDAVRAPFLRFKSAVAPLLGQVFHEGRAAAVASSKVEATDELARLNRAYLELEATLEERTNALRLILDSAGDAFVLVDFDGTLHGDLTKLACKWFGEAPAQATASGYLFGDGTHDARWFDAGLEQIADDFLTFEVGADAMPKRLKRDNFFYDLSYAPVAERGHFARVLVTVRDVTARIAAEAAERRAREQAALITHVLRNPSGLRRFVAEARQLIDRVVASSDIPSILRSLHTLKGTSAVYGLERFAAYVHDVESSFESRCSPTDPNWKEALTRTWVETLSSIEVLVDLTPTRDTIEITTAEHAALLAALEGRVDPMAVAADVRAWRLERVAVPLGRLAREAERLAGRLGKPVDVVVADGRVRIPIQSNVEFWSALVHVVRNAVDHGLEAREEREAAGKDVRGKIVLSARHSGNDIEVTISDDGRGVDWETLSKLVPSASGRSSLVRALFRDGISTRDEVGQVSGRGVGLAAVREACERIGATVEVESPAPQRGTVFRFRIPSAA